MGGNREKAEVLKDENAKRPSLSVRGELSTQSRGDQERWPGRPVIDRVTGALSNSEIHSREMKTIFCHFYSKSSFESQLGHNLGCSSVVKSITQHPNPSTRRRAHHYRPPA